MNKGQQIMSDYNNVTKYAQRKEDGTKEEWNESVDRIYDMHMRKYRVLMDNRLEDMIGGCRVSEYNKEILSAQRLRQFATPDASRGILKHNTKAYNCSGTHIDRIEVFSELMFILLAGAGAGISIQKRHIRKLPRVRITDKLNPNTHVIGDSIEGWANAVHALIRSYMGNDRREVTFDYSEIRAKGELIAGQFLAPGSKSLEIGLEKIRKILEVGAILERTLRPIEIYDIAMFIAETVLSGGVRRSAMLVMFDLDDEEMLNAKIGQYWLDNPQRAMSNNSAVILKTEAKKEDFSLIIEKVKSVGEPGFALVDNYDVVYNPCFEVGMLPFYMLHGSRHSGWSFCNLSEINGALTDTEEKFLDACRKASIVGTLQAGYTSFPYLGQWTEKIVERDALIGVSITGIMNNPDILLDPEILRKGANMVNETNALVAEMININTAVRTTVIKPAGNSSVLLGTASGIHAEEARAYLRNIKANRHEVGVSHMLKRNPHMVTGYNKDDFNIAFAIKPNKGSIIKEDNLGVEALKKVAIVQQNWVLPGTVEATTYGVKVNHNVSNTINVAPHQWDEVRDYIWDNREIFTGVSLLGTDSVLSYKDAPFQTVRTPLELATEYGSAAILASGLVTDGMRIFKHLWDATDLVVKNKLDLDTSENIIERVLITRKLDWIRRVRKFSNNFLKGDLDKAIRCLKEVSILHKYNKVRNESMVIEWSFVDFSNETRKEASDLEAACAGNACEVK